MNYQFSDNALSLLNNYYMKDGEAPTEAFRRAAYAYTPNKELAERELLTMQLMDGSCLVVLFSLMQVVQGYLLVAS